MRKLSLLLAGSVLVAAAASASAQVFTPGDLVVTTYGSSTSTTLLDGQATAITLNEYSLPTATSASLVMADQLPTTGTNGNVGIVGEYGSSSEGTLQVSGNGQYLTIGGYDGNLAENGAPAGGYGGNNTAEAQSTDTNVPRVAALINLSTGSVNTSTVLNDVYNTNNPRSVYSPDGTSLYLSGQGAGKTDEGGLYKTTVGTNTTVGGASAPTPIFNVVSTRTVKQANVDASTGTNSASPNTYYSADQNSTSKGTQTGIFEYTGSPTTSQGANTGIRLTAASGTVNGTTVNFSPQGFAFANATTLYVADTGDPKAGATGDGGIQKWTFAAGSWTLAYTLTDANFVDPTQATSVAHGETGFADMTLELDGNNVDIYAVSYTAGDADPNGLYAIVDNLSAKTLPTGADAESFTELEKASGLSNANGEDENFKGVAFLPAAAPEPSTTAMLILALLGGAAFAWKRKNALKA
jgi:PEP-CTERM motif